MLSHQSITASYPLAEQLDATGVIVTAMPGTPLDAICKATRGVESSTIRSEDVGWLVDPFVLVESTNTKNELYESTQHDLVMSDVVQVAKDTVQRNISLARNHVAPLVKQLVDMVLLRLNGASASAIARVEINATDAVGALYNPALADLIEKFQLTPANDPPVDTSLPRLSASEILPLLETGVASLDADIAEWAAGLRGYDLERTWNDFFCQNTPAGEDENFITCNSELTFSGRLAGDSQAPLVVFLIARHLIENEKVLDGTGMSLNGYNKTLQAFMEQAGMTLNRQLEKNNAAIEVGILVTSIDGYTINVNTPVYNTWLNNGGDNDILFGMLVSNKPAFTVGLINQSADFYKEAWGKYEAIIMEADSNQRFSFVQEQLVLCFENMLTSEEFDGAPLDTRLVHDIMKRYKDLVDGLSEEDTQDLYRCCLKLVCRARFYVTAAESILTKMDDVAKTNPKLSPREAGAVAVLSYITEWVASQMTVVAA